MLAKRLRKSYLKKSKKTILTPIKKLKKDKQYIKKN